ncbi:diguanylate cyclase [Ideonella sp.]|uniref:diguanylate cyclase n=1 Tax=Ideonella sp. TaxID=1929293 RepID=UPI0035B1B7F2
MPGLDDALRGVLMYVLVPVWAAAGVGDWWCHRRDDMAHTAGWREAALHLVMLAILGPAVLLALLAEITAGVLGLLLAACVLHEAVFWWDLRYASRHRVIGPMEQWVHGVQFAAPWIGLAGVALLHRAQMLAMAGHPAAGPPDWSVRWKQPALPPDYLVGVVVAGLAVIALPFLNELWRCVRARRATQAAHADTSQAGLATMR